MNTLLKLGFRRKHRPSVLDLFRPDVDYPLHDYRTPTTPDNLQLRRAHDLGLLEDPVQHKSPTWAQLAHADIERYFGKHPIEE